MGKWDIVFCLGLGIVGIGAIVAFFGTPIELSILFLSIGGAMCTIAAIAHKSKSKPAD